MMHPGKRILFAIIVLLLAGSCRMLNPSQMLVTGDHYPYASLPTDKTLDPYLIAPNDILEIAVATNNGQNLINPVATASGNINTSQQYLVEADGMVNLPLLNRVKIGGMTLKDAEKFLEDKFSVFFKDPFVTVKVTNNRVIVFPGGTGSNAQVIKLENTNTTLFEALALAGGINDGKAYRIKLIRGELLDRKVYLIDLSRIDGLKDADIVLKANDIIYVEPVQKVPQAILNKISPYLALVSTFAIIYALFR